MVASVATSSPVIAATMRCFRLRACIMLSAVFVQSGTSFFLPAGNCCRHMLWRGPALPRSSSQHRRTHSDGGVITMGAAGKKKKKVPASLLRRTPSVPATDSNHVCSVLLVVSGTHSFLKKHEQRGVGVVFVRKESVCICGVQCSIDRLVCCICS